MIIPFSLSLNFLYKFFRTDNRRLLEELVEECVEECVESEQTGRQGRDRANQLRPTLGSFYMTDSKCFMCVSTRVARTCFPRPFLVEIDLSNNGIHVFLCLDYCNLIYISSSPYSHMLAHLSLYLFIHILIHKF